MRKFTFFLTLIFLVVTASAQKGIVDCSQLVKSDILKREISYSVYLPEGYNESNRHYPVLYLLHGMWGNYSDWVTLGEVNRIASELITNGDIPEMIVIMPDGLTDAFYVNNYDNSIRWEDFFYKEFIPSIEKKYRILGNRNNRAIAGLSMGGYGALYHAIKHSAMYKNCYALSAAVIEVEPIKEGQKQAENNKAIQAKIWGPINAEGLPENYKKYSIQETIKAMESYKTPSAYEVMTGSNFGLPAITLDCGDDDFLLNQNMNLVRIMKEKQVPFEFRVREGSHTWEYWRTGLELALKTIGHSFRN